MAHNLSNNNNASETKLSFLSTHPKFPMRMINHAP